MAASPRDLGPILLLEAEAIGEPGRRTFRLVAANEDELAHIWIEKEQLQALGIAIDQMLATLLDAVGRG